MLTVLVYTKEKAIWRAMVRFILMDGCQNYFSLSSWPVILSELSDTTGQSLFRLKSQCLNTAI